MQWRSYEESCDQHHKGDECGPEGEHVERGERHVGRSNLDGKKIVPEAALWGRGQHEEHHNRAVHGHKHEVGFRLNVPKNRQARGRPDQVDSHQQRKAHADEHRYQRQEVVLKPDYLVVQTKNVFADEALRGRVRVYDFRASHLLFLRLLRGQPFIKFFLADYFQHPMHLVMA